MSGFAHAGWMIVAMTFAAIATILAKELTFDLPVVEILWLRLALACGLLWPVFRMVTGRSAPGFSRLHALRAATLIGMTGFWFLALSLGPVAQAAVISYTYPVIILVFAALFFGQQIGRCEVASLVLSFAGVALIFGFGPSGGPPTGQDFLQMGTVLLVSILIALRVSIEKVMTDRSDPFDILLGSMLIATVFTLPAAGVVWVTPAAHHMWLLVGLAVAATLSQLIVIWLVKGGAWSAVSIFAFWEVLAAIALAVILFGETLAAYGMFGAALIISGGLIQVTRRPGESR